MLTKEYFDEQYWKYFLLLENEYLTVEKIIPVDDLNKDTYSTNYMKLLFSVCSELDVLLKKYIEYNQWGTFKNDDGNFGKYRTIINLYLPKFSQEIILYSNMKEIKPFENWQQNKKPVWWNDYNNIKHKRTNINDNHMENYKTANQKNMLAALSALYQTEMYFYKTILDKNNDTHRLRMPVPQSERFRIKDWVDNAPLIANRYILYVDQSDGNLHLEGEL